MDHLHSGPPPEDTARALADIGSAVVRALAGRQSLSFTAASTLARLEREGPSRLTALAAAESVTQPSMTQLVQRLESRGLVERIGDPDDGRVTLIAVTGAGRDELAARRRARDARLADLMTTLSEEEQQALGAAVRTALPLVQRMIRAGEQPQRTGDLTTGSAR
ncbi:MarR family winged helix-turn-helix transcriptional regulator [Streptomyces brasiliensis]|uniref:HTH marR-type domain-containing protein n=1 Tax=Streptomyces brasiliensis TaxID=1954 RepID=A0A917NF71_9ACTN|nr:MarR family winged helix-turn-helix transcriptional regulator [Streptomyces brasiliensis]GGI95033.1 hypothetical protein GCM10010121_001750 [Streptomyces brasiliensis]